MTELEQIEEILAEAAAYGLSYEVEATANIYMKDPNINKIEAYNLAFNEWCK